ncbi:MAG: hypothetical protein J6Y42_01420 [Bacilli bacterium]|nr:hypothetical protein [Bacilli bacterium]
MKMIKKLLTFLFLVVLVLSLCACKKDNGGNNGGKEPEEDWASKRVSEITEIEAMSNTYFEYDEFSIDMYKFLVTYTDSTSREVSLAPDMLDEKDLNKLSKAGNPRIYIVYDWNGELFGLTVTVHLSDLSLLDEDLNKDGSHGAVIKAIRDKSQNRIDFILEASNGVKALQFKYVCDASIMTIADPKANSSLQGMFDFKLENNSVTATIVLDSASTTEVTLFSVSFNGNFRTSNLRLDESFDNAVYGIDEELQPVLLDNVLFHASKK